MLPITTLAAWKYFGRTSRLTTMTRRRPQIPGLWSALIACAALAPGTRASHAQQSFARITIDSRHQLRIIRADRHVIVPPLDSDQVAFEQPALSHDRRIAGWVASFKNCCTTYPLPLELVL